MTLPHISHVRVLASFANRLGPVGLRELVADQVAALISMDSGRSVVIHAADLHCTETTAADPPPTRAGRCALVRSFRVEVENVEVEMTAHV